MRTSVSVILALFQECLDDGCTQSALKVHVASIVAHHAPTAACSIGKNYLIIRFPTDVEFISFIQGTGYNIWFSPPSREQQDINLLCLVQALHIYTEHSSHFHNFVHSKITLFLAFFHPHSVVPVQTWMTACFLWNTTWDFFVMHFSFLLFPMHYSEWRP